MDDLDALDLFALVALHGHLSNDHVRNVTLDELADHCYAIAGAMFNARVRLDDADYEEWMGS